jgi:hypothetical protein
MKFALGVKSSRRSSYFSQFFALSSVCGWTVFHLSVAVLPHIEAKTEFDALFIIWKAALCQAVIEKLYTTACASRR